MKELEDYSWFPAVLRKFQTDYIGFVVSKFSIYEGFIEYLNKQNVKANIQFDLCSGSAEPASTIFKKSSSFNELLLSDKFPSYPSIKNVDVLEAKFEDRFTYTMFNAFHHFDDKEKLQIVEKIKNAKAQAYFVEILEPNFLFIIKVLFATTIGTILISPFIKPFSFKRLFFTYIIPINIINISYDGIISVLKSRSLSQYQELFLNDKNVEVLRIKKDIRTLIVISIHL